jgi:hypothetical protein
VQSLGIRLFLARAHNRGMRNTLRMLRYHVHHFVRYSTPVKITNLVSVKAQKWLKFDTVRGMPYRYNIDPVNICNLKCPVCPTGLGTLGANGLEWTWITLRGLLTRSFGMHMFWNSTIGGSHFFIHTFLK